MKTLAILLVLALTACASPYVAPTPTEWGRIASGTGRVVEGRR